MKEQFQSFGKAMLVPISLIALSGLLLGLGGTLTDEMTMMSLGVSWGTYSDSFVYRFFLSFKGLGSVIIGNLGPLYAVGCAFSLAKKEKGWAAFSAMVCYLAMHNTISILLDSYGINAVNTTVEALEATGLTSIEASKVSALYVTHLGFFTYSMGVLGGIIVGCLIAFITSKFYNTKLPTALSFFAGTRTVPIVSLILGGILGIIFFFIWPTIGRGLGFLSDFVHSSGLVGTFVYRFSVESLIPFGMHPLLETTMYWTELGGVAIVDGVRVVGTSAIQLAQLASPEQGKILLRSFMGGYGIINMAIYPGIALAMYKSARPENKKKVAGLLIPTIIATTCFGVTEPILFTFLFVAPWLYFLVYVPLAAIGEVLCEIFQVAIYQGNLKDWIPFLLHPDKINIVPYLWLYPIFFVLAYVLFRTLIVKFNVMTPGREEDKNEDEIRLYTKEDYKNKQENNKNNENKDINKDIALANGIVFALGGKGNIIDLDNCISRLRVVLKDPNLMAPDEVFKKDLKAMGVIHMGNAVQIIYGPAVAGIAADVHDVIEV